MSEQTKTPLAEARALVEQDGRWSFESIKALRSNGHRVIYRQGDCTMHIDVEWRDCMKITVRHASSVRQWERPDDCPWQHSLALWLAETSVWLGERRRASQTASARALRFRGGDTATLHPSIEAALDDLAAPQAPASMPPQPPMYRAARYIQGSAETWGLQMKAWKDASAGHGARAIEMTLRNEDVRVEALVDDCAASVTVAVERGFSVVKLDFVVRDVASDEGFEALRRDMRRLPEVVAQLRRVLAFQTAHAEATGPGGVP